MKIKRFLLAAVALLAFGACSETPEAPFTPGGNGGGNGGATEEGVYINETFAKSFGVFSTQETVGEYPWIIDYSTAKATSYVDTDGDGKGDTNKEATSWLISDAVDFTNETEAYVAFEYIIRYAESGKVANNHQLLISADYAGDAAAASWTDIPYGAVEGADWTTFYKANVAVPAEFLGKSGIVFALRYTATTKAGTWEVKNFKVAHGTAAEPEEPEEAQEYTVAEALAAFTGVAKPAVVKGYIVGSIDDKSIDDANFSGNAVLKTNLLIADNADETDIAKCLAVQLPSGDVRNALNLVDNPGNYKKLVTLTGSLEKYFGVAGLKSVSKYVIDGVTPEEPETPETGETIFAETFATSLGAFTTQETIGDYPWAFAKEYGAKASGYVNGASLDAESWLISPAIDLSNETAAYISFDYVINKGEANAAATNHKLVITSNYTGDVASTEWVEVNYGAVNNNNWDFHNTGKIALPETMMGQATVVIAFKYMSTTATSSTWEIKNVVVASGAGETPSTPETPEPEEPETPDTPDTPEAEAGVFDFTNPEALTPAYNRAEVGSQDGTPVEDGEIFTNGNLSIKFEKGTAGTNTRFWTKTGGDVEIRAYNGSTITVSVSEGTMSSIVFTGNKVSTMNADSGTFSEGTWSGDASSVTFSVTKTLNIQKITVK